jgi:palmitoyltransferase ZDHHC9/14/18
MTFIVSKVQTKSLLYMIMYACNSWCNMIRFVQTTYENFRYRYDEKENPYNRGVLANMSEVFCTGMPPSMNNFRAWVELPAPSPPEAFDGGGGGGPRNKIDLEMGYKGGGVQLPAGVPAILQGLHNYAEMEKNSASFHIKDRQSAEAPDPFMIPEELPMPYAGAGGASSPTVFVNDVDGVE